MSTPRALAALVLACAAAVASAFAPDALAPAVAALRGEGEGAARALQGTFGQLTVCEQDIPVAQQYPCDMLGTGTITVATVSLSCVPRAAPPRRGFLRAHPQPLAYPPPQLRGLVRPDYYHDVQQ